MGNLIGRMQALPGRTHVYDEACLAGDRGYLVGYDVKREEESFVGFVKAEVQETCLQPGAHLVMQEGRPMQSQR
jgi:hypothetical protein